MPDFPYINARVRAMRSRLLTPAQIEDMLALPSLAAFLQALAATPYAVDLQEAQVRYDGVRAVDAALAGNLQRTTRSILEFADGAPRHLITVLLLRWDLANLQALVRGKHAGWPAERLVDALLPAGTLSELTLKEMAGHPNLTALAGTLEVVNHPLVMALVEGVAEYANTRDPLSIELRLTRAYAGYVLRQSRGAEARALREILRSELDATNIKTALRLASARATAPGALSSEEERLRFFISGGATVTEKLFLELSDERTQARAWRHLRVLGFPVKTLPEDLVAFERELDVRMTDALAARYVMGDPLGLDIVIGYLAMKSGEVANLRLIARGKFLGLAREAVRRELVRV
ncbi:MAG: V-type ATPase subunit [Armatimonadota bacterium]|nr:V-type ATPase subunit [Armatimonadota bacterium]